MYFKNDRYIFRKVRFDKGEPCKCLAQEVEKGGYFLGSRRGFILTEANNTKNFFNEGKEAFYILIRNDKLQIELAQIFLHFCLWPLVTRCQGVEVKGSIRKKICVWWEGRKRRSSSGGKGEAAVEMGSGSLHTGKFCVKLELDGKLRFLRHVQGQRSILYMNEGCSLLNFVCHC